MHKPTGSLGDLGGWDVSACSKFHQTSTLCDTTCHSRWACPEGPSHRYGEAQLRYHYNRKIGRRELARSLGIPDQKEGLGPYWGDWAGED